MSYLKLIWDFKGPNSEHIAKHHEIHLKEFFDLEKKQSKLNYPVSKNYLESISNTRKLIINLNKNFAISS